MTGPRNALAGICPQTRHQHCRVHRMANILNQLPKSVQPKAGRNLHDIQQEDTRTAACKTFDDLVWSCRDKYPKSTRSLARDRQELMAFHAFPARHWASSRTTSSIGSTFATIRHRTRRYLSRDSMLGMLFRLAQCAESRW